MKLSMGLCQPPLTRPIPNRVSIRSPSVSVPLLEQAKIGERWKEFQGIKNWEGLLDPLDGSLRDEILRYGKFVEATYNSFDFDPSSTSYATCRFSKQSLLDRSGLPHTGYRVTRNLHATSGIQLPRWTKNFPKWMSKPSSWIGYVAVCQDDEEIARLGRRDVVVAYRGTATCLEWLENLRATLAPIPRVGRCPINVPMVEKGFLSLYTSFTRNCRSLRDEVRDEIKRVIQSTGDDEPISLTITGHSLGAALAILTAYDLTTTFGDRLGSVTVISFGGPRVGNKSFRCQVDKSGTKILRIVNSTDLITKVPGFIVNDDADEHKAALPLPRWLQKRAEHTQWLYADVGDELEISTQNSPMITSGPTNPATCHELDTYMHLVSGFVSSTCPFKASARRLLNCKLLRRDKAYAR